MTRDSTVALIATVLDEKPQLNRWLAALDAQTQTPDEIVVVDGGSTDGTWEMLQDWAVHSGATIRRAPGTGIAAGRNLAIGLANAEIVVVTDAGTVADPCWLERLLDAFEPDVDVVSGFFLPELARLWERALAATTLPDVDEIDPHRFQPSSRSLAFRRSWWAAGVRYPEWLDYCEDLVWDFAMRRAGARFRFAPDAFVLFSVRPTLRSFVLQYYRYARGDGKAGLFARRHLLRYGTYAAASAVFLRRRPLELTIAGTLALAYMRSPACRLWRRRGDTPLQDVAVTLGLAAALRAVGDIAKMAGYPVGLSWRLRRFGGLGWRTGWRRLSPAGVVWSPATLTRESRPPTSWRDDESRVAQP